MKKMKMYFFLLLAGLLVVSACQDDDDVVSPDLGVRPDATLTNEQIEQKLEAFDLARKVDATPNNAVAAKFNSQFASARDIEWEKASDVYEVEFEVKRVDCQAWYDADGNLLMLQQHIATSQLPDAVRSCVNQRYSGCRMDDAERFYKGTEIFYEASVKQGRRECNARFKEDGTFMRERWDD